MLVSARGLVRVHGSGPAARAVVDNVDIDVTDGEMVAIVGASGSGKSTLLNLLAGLDRPTRGTVSVAGQQLERCSESALARMRRTTIGIVFQSFRLVPELSAWENVLMPLRLAGDLDEGRTRAEELVERLGVAKVIRQLPSDLSGGEQQRVAIARALVMGPRVLFADEPTGNLDEHTGHEVIGLLRDAVTPTRSVVLVTHDAEQTRSADRVIRLRDGRIEA